MIAKLTVHATGREVALLKLERALGETEVAGSVTNLAFLGALTRHGGFARGDVDTGLIGRDLAELTLEPEPSDRIRAMAVLVAMDLAGGCDWRTGFNLWSPLSQTVGLEYGGQEFAAEVTHLGGGRHLVRLGDAKVEALCQAGGWTLDDEKAPRHIRKGARISIFAGHGFHFDIIDVLDRAGAHAGDGNVIAAPMPGLVKSMHVSPGDKVAAGDRLAVLEAMKMEHSLTALRDGVVAEVLASAGSQVEAGAALIRLEDAAEEKT